MLVLESLEAYCQGEVSQYKIKTNVFYVYTQQNSVLGRSINKRDGVDSSDVYAAPHLKNKAMQILLRIFLLHLPR
jgi:hypothetical protein